MEHPADRSAFELDFDPRLRLLRVKLLRESDKGRSVYVPSEQVCSMVIAEATLEAERPQKKA